MEENLDLYANNLLRTNDFAQKIASNEFQIITEINSQEKAQSWNFVSTRVEQISVQCHKCEKKSSILLLDRNRHEKAHSQDLVLNELLKFYKNEPILTISGKGNDVESVRKKITDATNSGVKIFIAVSGDKLESHNSTRVKNFNYLESTKIVKLIREIAPKSLIGIGINPFKYTVEESLMQYLKMIKKLNFGADFIFTNRGWDMAKLQELRCFLDFRGLEIPVFARLMVPSVELIEFISTKIFPGVHTSKRFAAKLQHELKDSRQNSLANNLHRVALMTVGCKLLGYYGVSINYANYNTDCIEILMKLVNQYERTLSTYGLWLKKWNDFNGDIQFNPERLDYYFFKDLLSSKVFNLSEKLHLKEQVIEVPKFKEKVMYQLRGLRNKDEKNCCPKLLNDGCCGGTAPTGICEFEHQICHFKKQFIILNWKEKLKKLEE